VDESASFLNNVAKIAVEPKIVKIYSGAKFESPKHPYQTTFENQK